MFSKMCIYSMQHWLKILLLVLIKKDINFESLETVIEQASLKDFIDSLPEG